MERRREERHTQAPPRRQTRAAKGEKAEKAGTEPREGIQEAWEGSNQSKRAGARACAEDRTEGRRAKRARGGDRKGTEACERGWGRRGNRAEAGGRGKNGRKKKGCGAGKKRREAGMEGGGERIREGERKVQAARGRTGGEPSQDKGGGQ